jgi:hypothetical protein
MSIAAYLADGTWVASAFGPLDGRIAAHEAPLGFDAVDRPGRVVNRRHVSPGIRLSGV